MAFPAPARADVVTFRVTPVMKRVIRAAARQDARTVSSFLSFLVERSLIDQKGERADA